MTSEELKDLALKNGGYIFKDRDGAYQTIGPYCAPVKVTWTTRFSGKATGQGMYAHAQLSATTTSNPNKQILWTSEDRKFDTYNLSSEKLSEAHRTIWLSALNTLCLMFEAYDEHADNQVSSLLVSATP